MRRRIQASAAFLVTARSAPLVKSRFSNPIMNMPTVPRLLRLRGNESVTNKLFLSTEALPSEARHETRAGVVFPGFGCRFHTQHAISRGRRCHEEGDYLNAQLYAVDGNISVRSMR